MQAEIAVAYPATACPAGTAVTVECFTRTGTGIIPGLGNVQESYPYFVEDAPAGCGENKVRVLPTTARVSVAGKGSLELRLSGTDCLTRTPPLPLDAQETFTIDGGSDRWTGASGEGTLTHISSGPPALRGKDTWVGTLLVPGFDFDLVPPTLRGVADKVVRAPKGARRARVTFNVTAVDDVDGTLAASCAPKPGSRFKIGRTTVTCSASDTSGNIKVARFSVVVRRT
jgi:hypothetical protein